MSKMIEVFVPDIGDFDAVEVIEILVSEGDTINVEDSLMITETQLQEFRSRNRIMDVSAQAQQIIDQAVVLENEEARLNLERNYFEYLEEYLSSEDNKKIPVSPASMGIEDPLLANLMQEYPIVGMVNMENMPTPQLQSM